MLDNPRKILNIAVPEVKVGQLANLTIFNTDEKWQFQSKHIKSKSKNTPYVGSEMIGRALGIVNKGQLILNNL